MTLGLTDPDSNEVVPAWAHRFAGKFMLTSQGDQEQIFFGGDKPLQVLSLTSSVDDTAWPSGDNGELLTTDNSDNEVIAVTGPFERGSEIAAVTPCDSNSAPAVCPGPDYPPNYLGRINPWTGVISALPVSGPDVPATGDAVPPRRAELSSAQARLRASGPAAVRLPTILGSGGRPQAGGAPGA